MIDKNENNDRVIGGRVESVVSDSPAAYAGIAAGDIVLSLDGHALHDVIDYQFYLDSGPQQIEIDRKKERLVKEMDCDEGDDPG
ncbi:MAG: PDZ domain-containing protein, partial [Thermoleophilia bacterium]